MGDIPALSMLKDKIWKIKFLPRFEEQQDFREYIQYCGEMLSNAILVLGEVRGYMNRIEERITELATYIRDASGTVQSDMNIALSQVKDIRRIVEKSRPRTASPQKSMLPNIEITDSVVGSYSQLQDQEMNKQRTLETLDREANLVETLMTNIDAITSSNSKVVQVSDITHVLVELETILLDTDYIEYQTKAVDDVVNRGEEGDITAEHLDMFDAANMISFSDLEIDKVNTIRDERMTRISEETEDDNESEKDGKRKNARTPRSKSKSSHRKHSSKSNASKRRIESELPELDLEFARGDEVSDMDGVLSFRINNNDQIVLDEAASYRAKQAIYFEEKKIKREQERRRLEREMRRKQGRRDSIRSQDDENDRDLEEMYRRLESEKKRLENGRTRTEELRSQREVKFKKLDEEERERKLVEEKKRLSEEEKARKLARQTELKTQQQQTEKAETEAKRKEAEKRRQEDERICKEEQDRLRRQNSRNWDNFVYKRPVVRVNEETETYHKGICCLVSAVTSRLTNGDLECVPSDDVDVINTCLDNGDRLASSVVTITSNVGSINLEAPVRVYIPHVTIPEGDDELLMKVAVNGGEWQYQKPLRHPKKQSQGVQLIGAGLDNFQSAKLVVVARHKAEGVMVTTEEVSLSSAFNRYVKIAIQKDTFTSETCVRFEAHKVAESLVAKCKGLSETCKCVLACRTMVTLRCERPPAKPITVRFLDSVQGPRKNVEVAARLYKAETDDWVIDRADPNPDNDAGFVELPAKYRYYTVTEVVVLQSTPDEDIVTAVDFLHACLHGNVVKLIVKQRRDNISRAIIHCITEQVADAREKLLEEVGFNTGPPSSQDMCMREGQELCLSCNGNVAFASPSEDTIRLPFFRYFDRANVQVELRVADTFLQKTLPEYIGHIQGYIQGPRVDPQPPPIGDVERNVAMCMVLPKTRPAAKKKSDSPVAGVGLPSYVLAFARFVSVRLCEPTGDEKRLKVLAELEGKRKLKSMLRKARLKVGDDGGDVAVSTTIITDWMKTKPKYADKLTPILGALEKHKLHEVKNECKQFMKVYKGLLSDSALQTIADNLHEDNDTIGRRLGLTNSDLDLLLYNASGTRKFKAVTLMMKWRESDEAVQHGGEMFDKLLEQLALDEDIAERLKATITSSAAAAT